MRERQGRTGDWATSDIESQHENVWESDASSDSDVLDNQSEIDIEDDDTTKASLESDIYLAKCFLERNWGRTCNCEEEGEENDVEQASQNEQQVLGLLDMTDYWRNIGLPDSISNASPHAVVDENGPTQLNWSSILSGGASRPKLDIQVSQSLATLLRSWGGPPTAHDLSSLRRNYLGLLSLRSLLITQCI
jgi:hypothetical protein